MKQFLESTPAQVVIWLSVLASLVAVGGYVVGRFRGRSGEEQLEADRLLTKFREMHRRGDIADAEFRNIKTVLGARLQAELNVSVGKGSDQVSESAEGVHQADDSDKNGP